MTTQPKANHYDLFNALDGKGERRSATVTKTGDTEWRATAKPIYAVSSVGEWHALMRLCARLAAQKFYTRSVVGPNEAVSGG